MHWFNHHPPVPLVSGDWFFGRFLLGLGRVKRNQVLSMVKLSPIAINFGCDSVYRTQVRSLAMLVSDALTHSCLVNLIDVTLACEDANSILVEVVTVDAEKRVDNSLVQIWELKF